MKFSKKKTLESIRKAGNMDKVTQEMLDDMDNFDGCEAVKNRWKGLVHDEEVYTVIGKDGRVFEFPPEMIE